MADDSSPYLDGARRNGRRPAAAATGDMLAAKYSVSADSSEGKVEAEPEPDGRPIGDDTVTGTNKQARRTTTTNEQGGHNQIYLEVKPTALTAAEGPPGLMAGPR